MSGISTGVGLASGLNIAEIVDSLISVQRRPIDRLQERAESFTAVQTGMKSLEAFVLSIKTAAQKLGNETVVRGLTSSNSDEEQLAVSVGTDASPGAHHLQVLRNATSHAVMARGFANVDSQKVGAGTIEIAGDGGLATSTRLDVLNGGSGVQRGAIRVTDRAGNSADVDLTDAFTVDDVLQAVNAASGVSVKASTLGSRLVIEDLSGGGGSLSVAEVGAGTTASDLGIAQTTGSDSLTGESVYELTGAFTLDLINDGNALRRLEGAPDLRITLTDDTAIEVNLDAAASLDDVLTAINDHADNGGKLQASLVDGRLRLEDLSGGGGTSAFAVEDANGANVVDALGLTEAASGTTLDGRRLLGGINSVLLSNLRGGRGVEVLGSIAITDRAGGTATIDLSTASSLDEVLAAINDEATVQVEAVLDSAGTGIEVRDLSGGGGNLTIADVATGTAARDLGIAIDAAENGVASGSLGRRFVNEATHVRELLAPGETLSTGGFTITDSAGNVATIDVTSALETVGDLMQRVNAATGVSVTAQLNATGDGFEIVDDAGGPGTLVVADGSGTAAEQLGLAGEAVTGPDGEQRVSATATTTIEVDADDTLQDVADKLNESGGPVKAVIVDDGTAFGSKRLQLVAADSGLEGRFHVREDVGLDFSTFGVGRDALLRVGDDASTAFLLASGDGTFEDVVTGVDVTAIAPGVFPAEVVVERDTAGFESAIKSFVTAYNAYVDNAAKLTRFDPETNERGVLNGEATVIRISSRLDTIVNRRLNRLDGSIQSLGQLGVRTTNGGKLVFDTEQFARVLAEDPEDVADFFLAEDDGFAAAAGDSLDALTDPFTGTFALEVDSLQSSVDSLTARIEQLNESLAVKRQRLLQRFVRMEESIALLQSQQSALGRIQPLRINPAPRLPSGSTGS